MQPATAVDVPTTGELTPVTPESSRRYSRKHTIQLECGDIEARQADPKYPVSDWFSYTHPEGQLYHVLVSQGRVRTVTDEDVDDPTVLDNVLAWIGRIEQKLAANLVDMHSDIELMVELRGQDCGYYLVDHRARTIFWAETTFTHEVDLPDVSSPTHLATRTEAQFWRHVEYYPSHFGGLPQRDIDTLYSVFSHGLTDQLTSPTSTFPYKVQDCTHFVSILGGLKGHPTDPYATWVVARLWALVYLYRADVHYGTPYARLNRNQRILEFHEEELKIMRCASLATFRVWDDYRARLDDQYNDESIYGDYWRKFIDHILNDWKTVASHSLFVLLAHSALLFVSSYAPLALASATVTGLSILCSMFLIHRHSALVNTGTPTAQAYIPAVCHEKYRFQFTALAMALPRALHFWGIALLAMNFLFIVASSCGIIPTLLITIAASGCCALLHFCTVTLKVAPEDMILPYSISSSDLKA